MRFLIFLLLGISLQASSQYDQGKKLYFSEGCNGCHGITASGTHQYPALAYRRKPFLSTKLKEYRAKKASTQLDQMMIPFALELTDAQIDALTTFLSEFNENKKSPSNSFNIRGDGGS